MKVRILGMGHAVPEKILNNVDLEKMVDTSDDWIRERTGIRERRIADASKATSDYCTEAAQMALEQAGISAAELDLIIVATVTPDMLFPSTACLIQDKLGANNAAAFDLSAGCTGFIYGMDIARNCLMASAYKHVLVVGADLLSRITDYQDRSTCVLFGDGAGAAILGKVSGEEGTFNTFLGADGSGGDLLKIPAGGSLLPASHTTVEERLHFTKMNGNEIFRFASRIIVQVSEKLLQDAGLDYKDVDVFIPHQANLRIIQTAMKRMNIPEGKTIINIDRFGNMSSASIPVAMSIAVKEGKINSGDLLLAVAFGAGLTYGGLLVRWGRD